MRQPERVRLAEKRGVGAPEGMKAIIFITLNLIYKMPT
jgi:hypothetical protein